MKIGIIGAGFVGREIGKAAVRKGHEVMLSNSRGPRSLYTWKSGTGCEVGTVEDAARFGDIVIVGTPLDAYDSFPASPLAGKILVDANNYHPLRDGAIEALDKKEMTVSEMLAGYFPGSRVVKAFNSIRMAEFERDARPAGDPGRRAIPIAGDNGPDKQLVAKLIDELGYDTVDAGPLAEGWRFDHGSPVYCRPLGRAELAKGLEMTRPEDASPGGVGR